MDRLRGETRDLHVAVEAVVPILRPGADAATYSRYLQRMLGFHRPLEARIRAAHGVEHFLQQFAPTWKSPLIARDLVALGHSSDDVEALPDCGGVPAADSVPFALGCLYVIEGATLGGRVIHRQLSARMPDAMQRASHYFQVYEPATATSWRAFGAALTGHAGDPRSQDAMVAGAAQTFSSLLVWLES